MGQIAFIRQKLFAGNRRWAKAKKNIFVSFFIKGCDALVYFLLVPLTLGYLNEYEYGIWLTLSSILVWINSFDIGLGNGLRNKLAEALAREDWQLCKSYVSTTFGMLCILMGVLLVLGALLMPLLDWYTILGATATTVPRLNEIVFISFALFCLNFALKFIGNVYLALQLPAVNNLLVMLGHAMSLLVIFVLIHTTRGSLLYVALAYSAAPPLIYALAYPLTFGRKYRFMAPSVRAFRLEHLKSLFSMGVLFFVIQLGGLMLFSTANLIISHEFGPENVTPFNIAYRYFSLVLICFSLIISPMWAATTDAYTQGDLEWIRSAMRNFRKILLFITALLIAMVLLSGPVYRVWIGDKVEIPFSLTVAMAAYIFIIIWSLAYSNFLNGMGKLRLQAVNTIMAGLLFIPVGIFAGRWLGLLGILVALCLANASGAVINRLQFHLVVSGRAKGIWNH